MAHESCFEKHAFRPILNYGLTLAVLRYNLSAHPPVQLTTALASTAALEAEVGTLQATVSRQTRQARGHLQNYSYQTVLKLRSKLALAQ